MYLFQQCHQRADNKFCLILIQLPTLNEVFKTTSPQRFINSIKFVLIVKCEVKSDKSVIVPFQQPQFEHHPLRCSVIQHLLLIDCPNEVSDLVLV